MKVYSVIKCLLAACLLMSAVGITRAEALVGDAVRGERLFWSCRTCHYPEKIVGHNNGPSLWNIFGQQAGSQPGFEYSEAFQAVNFIWTPALMDIWLRDPTKFVPGNNMMNSVIENAQDRYDIIEYLKKFTE
jgi:cytochrome c